MIADPETGLAALQHNKTDLALSPRPIKATESPAWAFHYPRDSLPERSIPHSTSAHGASSSRTRPLWFVARKKPSPWFCSCNNTPLNWFVLPTKPGALNHPLR